MVTMTQMLGLLLLSWGVAGMCVWFDMLTGKLRKPLGGWLSGR